MPKLETIRLRTTKPDALKQFYCQTLGMTERADGAVGYGEQEAWLLFEECEQPYQLQSNDLYWKVAIAVPNIELAFRQLVARGVQIKPPSQFQQIGFLTHFMDPAGFVVELIDHWFEGERPLREFDEEKLGGGPHLNLLTLRSQSISEVEKLCLSWGMQPLSVQPVVDRGFTLYFYAFTKDKPPSTDLLAIENRTWVYQRPYTVLELQVPNNAQTRMRSPVNENESGYTGALISGLEPSQRFAPLLLQGSD